MITWPRPIGHKSRALGSQSVVPFLLPKWIALNQAIYLVTDITDPDWGTESWSALLRLSPIVADATCQRRPSLHANSQFLLWVLAVARDRRAKQMDKASPSSGQKVIGVWFNQAGKPKTPFEADIITSEVGNMPEAIRSNHEWTSQIQTAAFDFGQC